MACLYPNEMPLAQSVVIPEAETSENSLIKNWVHSFPGTVVFFVSFSFFIFHLSSCLEVFGMRNPPVAVGLVNGG